MVAGHLEPVLTDTTASASPGLAAKTPSVATNTAMAVIFLGVAIVKRFSGKAAVAEER